jgi:hypothetical protein
LLSKEIVNSPFSLSCLLLFSALSREVLSHSVSQFEHPYEDIVELVFEHPFLGVVPSSTMAPQESRLLFELNRKSATRLVDTCRGAENGTSSCR